MKTARSTRGLNGSGVDGAFSVSESMSNTVKKYIDNQEQHHANQSFEDEYFALLKKHRIEFDKRYVFDDEIVG